VSNVTDSVVPIAWEEIGEGPPLLLIMGLGYARWAWDPIVPQLSTRYRVITFDNRGIGESGIPDGPYTVAEMATDALAVLESAAADRAHVVGASLGGMIAQHVAYEHPDVVDRLVLLSTTPGGPDSYPMPEVTVKLMTDSADMAPEEALRRFVENALSDHADPSTIDTLVERRLASPQPRDAWAAQAAAGAGFDASSRVGEITAPTLIVHGQSDNVVDPANAPVLATLIPDSRVEMVPGGHLFFWEDPTLAAGLIMSFLDEEA
jgi:pimeloyl-ACP methyl ester carboxylesterase